MKTAHVVPDSSLMQKLRTIRGEYIYRLAPLRVIDRAMRYVDEQHLENFLWNKSRDELVATVAGTRRYGVAFFLDEDDLQMECTCRAAEDGEVCKHQVAALFFISHTLSDTSFGKQIYNMPDILRLKKQILAPYHNIHDVEQPRAWLEFRDGYNFSRPLYQTKQPYSNVSSYSQPPPELRPILYNEGPYATKFLDWIASGANPQVEIHYLENQQNQPLVITRQVEPKANAWVTANLQKDSVALQRSWEPTKARPFGNELLLYPDPPRLGGLNPTGAWALLEEISHDNLSRNPRQTDQNTRYHHDYNVLSFRKSDYFRKKDGLVLQVDGKIQTPETVPYALSAELNSSEEGFRIRLTCRLADYELPIFGWVFDAYNKVFYDGYHLIKSKRGANAFDRAWHLQFGIVEPGVFQALIESTCGPKIYSSPRMQRDAAKLLKSIHRAKKPNCKNLPIATPDGWKILEESPIGKIGQFIASAHALTGTGYAGQESSNSILVLGTTELPATANLPEFVQLAVGLGITVEMNQQPIRVLDLQVAVRAAGKKDKLDWFELHPSVMCEEMKIPEARWGEIITGGIITLDDGGMVMVSDSSRRAVSLVAGLVADLRGEGSSGTKKSALLFPRLRLLDWIDLARQGIQCQMPPEMEALLNSLRDFAQLAPEPLPRQIKAELRPYQHEGYSWLAFLYRHRLGACLADDMGLGKTLQAITLLAAIQEKIVTGTGAPHLVVLPPTLLFNWASEIEKFAPQLRVKEYTGTNRKAVFSDADIILTTYELARRDIAILSKEKFDIVLFDEAQHIKNWSGARSQAVRELPSQFRICLTGTPLENHIGEYHSILELALPGLLGERKHFLANCGPGSVALRRARPFVLRRRKSEILLDLPPKVESDTYLDFAPDQKEYYTRAVAEVRAEVLEAYRDKPRQQAGIIALSALTRLRQICVAPAVLDPGYTDRTPKLDHLVDQLEEITEESSAVIVFSQFVRVLDLVSKLLTERGLAHQKMDGKTPTPARKKLVADFQKSDGPPIFLISMKTGGAGLNLTRASYVFHLDPWWNPAVENQASDRAHRIGQQQTVFVQRLLMRHSVEEKMMVLKERKSEIFKRIVDGEGAVTSTGAISSEDFRFLLDTK